MAKLSANWPDNGLCPLCGREMVKGASLNEHHLVPKSYGGTEKWVMHKACHSKVHSVFSEVELARVYNTFDKLREHDAIKSFIKWIRKQDPERIIKHDRPSARS